MSSDAFLHEAEARGFVHQCTDPEGLRTALRQGVVSGYIGFDCTASSLHVGSLLQIMLLRLLQRHGHRPVVLMGGGTTRIGDPSGKDESRPTPRVSAAASPHSCALATARPTR
jgi:tyrosyl-tRNA synthetase